ncbi:c-type cytochrome [Pedobacter sp. HMF7056]|uniref:C-type cytochrome n=2 Tax=Hufsiella ginkgonis TaxID=2695274 RepID=A0A7K1XZ80_9SPHI|nr:cytochrome c [Hufsiella ginkgonis]MXV16315.1 c-type cytochrome [Hufsiella ginkgonis]
MTAVYSSCQDSSQLNYAWYYANGKQLYEQHCQNCHNADGSGLGALIPPLTDTVFMKERSGSLPCLVRDGVKGKMIVGGKPFDGEMPGNNKLADIDIAAVLTYVTNSFGNKQGIYETKRVGACVGVR